MSLRVWLPLNGDLRNNGLDNIEVVNNGATVDNSGKIGKCYYLSGNANSYINTNYSTNIGTSDFSISLWVKIPTITSGSYYAVCTSKSASAASSGFGIYWNYSQKKFLWSTADGTNATEIWMAATVDSIVYDKWIHLVMVRNNSDTKKGYFYINGERYELTSIPAIRNITIDTKLLLGKCSNGNYPIKAYYNDFRIYDHALSAKEVKELSKGLIAHYPLNQAFPIDNLVRNQTYFAYNNYSGSGSTATLVKTGKRYNDCDIYRLTYTPNDTSLNNVKTTLHSHGVYGFSRTFKANTKYCFWILWRAISHPDTICGGTASNIGGWTEIPTKKFSGEWNIVGQYRNGTVTTDKGDNIFTSFKTPSATSGTPIIIDFCCPHLVEGYDYILEENGYGGDTVTKIYDISGYNYYGIPTGNLIVNNDSARNSLSTVFTGSQYIAIGNKLYNARDEMTVNLWCYKSNWNTNVGTPFSSVESGGFGWQVSGTNYNFYCGTGVSSNTYIGSAVTTSSLSSGWHMLSATYDGLALRVYIDGVLKNTVVKYTTKTPIFYNVNSGMFISGESAGSLVSPSGSLYTGNISDVRIYCTALSEQDIKELYQVGASMDKGNNLHTYELLESGSNELLAVPYTNWYSQHNDIPSNWYKNINNGEIYFESTTVGSHAAGSRYIPINPTNKTYYYDFCISVSAGNLFYIGFERYDKDKTARSNNATVYIFGSKPSSDLVKARYKGVVNLSTDGVNPCAFIALRILNRWSGSTTETEGKATVHYLSLREVDNTTGFETTKLFKTGVFKADDFFEKNDKSNIEKDGIINMPNQFIEI